MEPTPLQELLDKYLTDGLLPQEREELMLRLENPADRKELEQLLQVSFLDDRFEAGDNPAFQSQLHEALQQYIDAEQVPVMPMRSNKTRWIAAAAAAIVVLTGGIWWMNAGKKKNPDQIATTASYYKNDVQPAAQAVILTLGDGREINLDASPDGALATDGGAQLTKQNGSISYSGANTNTSIVYNTIATSFGSVYQLELSDGTKVWLNATSSLRYPTSFTGNNRIVELTGEGYFEVAKNSKQPFLVKTGDANIQVLGTSFNVNAYGPNAVVRTTLLDGSVKLNEQILKPAQQGILKNNTVTVAAASIDEVMAWINGKFIFNLKPLTEIMEEVERWYGVKVVFANPVKEQFTSTLQRNMPVSKLLRNLELTGEVKFGIEGKTITVSSATP